LGLPTTEQAWARLGATERTSGEAATSARVVVAPIRSTSPARVIPARPGMRHSATSDCGATRPCRIISTSAVPPETTLVPHGSAAVPARPARSSPASLPPGEAAAGGPQQRPHEQREQAAPWSGGGRRRGSCDGHRLLGGGRGGADGLGGEGGVGAGGELAHQL